MTEHEQVASELERRLNALAHEVYHRCEEAEWGERGNADWTVEWGDITAVAAKEIAALLRSPREGTTAQAGERKPFDKLASLSVAGELEATARRRRGRATSVPSSEYAEALEQEAQLLESGACTIRELVAALTHDSVPPTILRDAARDNFVRALYRAVEGMSEDELHEIQAKYTADLTPHDELTDFITEAIQVAAQRVASVPPKPEASEPTEASNGK